MQDKLKRKKFICVGSGPSLTWEDIEHIGNYANYNDYAIVCVNNAYEFSDWLAADYLFASDLRWWRLHHNQVMNQTAEDTQTVTLFDNVRPLKKSGIELDLSFAHHTNKPMIGESDALYHGGCSGTLAVEMARVMGAEKIVLLGYDYQHTNGQSHYHGDHPSHFPNAVNTQRWVDEFGVLMQAYREKLPHIDVVNCSRETAIDSCRRSTLKEEIE